MAIAYVKARILSRQKSKRSVAAHLAYREGTTVGGYSAELRADSVVESYIVGWAGSTESFAAAIEASEVRKDAQTVRELIWALPHDASPEDRAKIAREYAESLRARYGVAVHVAIHSPRPKDDNIHGLDASGKNDHVHLSMTLRPVDDSGRLVGNKIREMNSKAWLDQEKDRLVGLVNSVATQERASRELKYGEPLPEIGVAWHAHRRGVKTAAGAQLVAAIADRDATIAARAELAQLAAEIATDRAALAEAERAEAAQVPPAPVTQAAPERLGLMDRARRLVGLRSKAEEQAAHARALALTAALIEQDKQRAEKAKADAAEAQRRAAEAAEAEEAAEARRIEEAKQRMAERSRTKPMDPVPPTPAEIRDQDKGPEPRQTPGRRRR